jgi:hypothetical protein
MFSVKEMPNKQFVSELAELSKASISKTWWAFASLFP